MSITNSNSNFGAQSLSAIGFRDTAFTQDDLGYVTHVIPPKQIPITENAIEFNAIDIGTTVGIATTNERLYLYDQTNFDAPPENVLEGYRVGARDLDDLIVLVPNSAGTPTEYKSRIVMPESQSSSAKIFNVDRSSAGINSITSSIVTLTEAHDFANAESVRVISDNGRLPDGLDANTVYFVITDSNSSSGLTTNIDVKLAKTETDAKNASALTINNLGGTLQVVSRVSDKNSGEIGHPIQWDSTESQWYIKVSTASTDNAIQPTVVVGLGTTALGAATPRSYIKRQSDNRAADDTTYRFRYIIPASSGGSVGRPPTDGFILQESNTSIGSTNSEIQTYFGSGSLSNVNEQRNFRFIANANWSSDVANILTELPHELSVDSRVELVNINSGVNTTGLGNSGYNGTFTVTGITSTREFTVGISTSPGVFTNDTLTRTTSLPYFKRKNYKETYFIQDVQEIQKYTQGEQDGIYYLTVLNSSNSPVVDPFTGEKFTQSLVNLYPQTNRDTPLSDPDPSISYSLSSPIGEVTVDNVEKSTTKETLNKFITDIDVGVGLTDINTSVAGTSHIIHTNVDHGLKRITKVSIANSGTQYGSGTDADFYNAKLVAFGSSVTGSNATAKIGVINGQVNTCIIMDGGSAYGVGNTLSVVGIATTGSTGHTSAVISVSEVYDNVGDVVRIAGVTSESYNQYNDVFRITTVDVGFAKSFVAYSDKSITGVTTTGIGTVPLSNASNYLTGQSIKLSNIAYNTTSGLATITSASAHGLKANAKVKLSTGIGGTIAAWDDSFVVKQNVSLTSFILNIGIGKTDATVAAGSSMFALREGITSNDGIPTLENESLNGRMVPTYAGITTTLATAISDAVTTEFRLTDVSTLGVQIGDYFAVDNEIVRVKTTPANPATNPLTVFRAVLGTRATTHSTGSLVRRIKAYPIELRRHSINRASGHTWEYVGYGPGNYSTALPDKQNRDITDTEELLAQSTRKNGGVNYFTGMNDKGIYYAGNKKVSTVTGKEEVFDTPIRTITGEDISNKSGINLVKATEATFSQSIRIDGGDEGKAISEFTGPVVFTNKVTSTASRGIEANSVFIQGDSTVSRKYTVGIATPTTAGTPGDVVYYENPEQGKYLGWVYTSNKDWRRFGNLSLSKTQNIYLFDQVGIATTTVGSNVLRVGAGASLFNVDGDGVGIGTVANGKKLWIEGDSHLNGNINYVGVITATLFAGNGSQLTNLNTSETTGWTPVQQTYAGAGNTGVYAFGSGDVLNARVGIGTSIPNYNLELGMDPTKYITTLGYAHTDLYVHNRSTFIGTITSGDIDMSSGRLRNMNGSYQLYDTGGLIYAGVTTSTRLMVGSSNTAIYTTAASYIGFGTESPRSKVDIDGRLRVKSMHENVQQLDISSGNVNVDLDKGQTFNLLVDEAVTQFTILNPPDEATSFTIKFTQNGTGYSVGIDTFKTAAGAAATVYWPGGGVLPIVTQTANKTDIYSFKSVDGCSSLFGIVGGQNFA